MLVGYARVSTTDQNPELQLDALRQVGCERIFTDRASGAKADRPALAELLTYVRNLDVAVVWRLDRLGRSLPDLISTVRQLEDQGVGFRSLTESIDTTTSGGRLVFHIFGALAEFERDIIRERTQAGLAAARARGRKGGRPRKLDAKKLAMAQRLLADPGVAVGEVCLTLGVSRSTLYRYVGRSGRVDEPEERTVLEGQIVQRRPT